ncbi:hypothetical protein [Actinophytocola sp. KF-1]
MSRREWVFLVLFVLSIAAAGAAPIVVDKLTSPEPAPPPPAAPPRTPCPDTADGEPKHPTEYTDRAAAYTGPGPHPMELVTPVLDVDGVYQYYGPDDRGLPLEWQADEENERQLVVCEYAVSAEPVVRSCEYLGNRWVQLAPATYRYRVFEARTSRAVKDFTLHSGEACPGSIEYREGDSPPARVLESVKFTELEKALRPIVDP